MATLAFSLAGFLRFDRQQPVTINVKFDFSWVAVFERHTLPHAEEPESKPVRRGWDYFANSDSKSSSAFTILPKQVAEICRPTFLAEST